MFQRPEHQAVAAVLQVMDHDWLTACRCWFGGGTEIVLDLGEYRLSRDIDFLCADTAGYRTLRAAALSGRTEAFFSQGVTLERPFRGDQYGIRALIRAREITIRFELVREARVELDGRPDPILGVPRLSHADRITEELLANADRCQDSSSLFRDAVDLGMLALRQGRFPTSAFAKARAAYGEEIDRELDWALATLAGPDRSQVTAAALGMDATLLRDALDALRSQIKGLNPC